MTPFVAIVPARLASTRLPRKPLADIGGRPMVVHVADRAREAGATRIVVATDSPEIVAACTAHGIEALLTSATHATGTDRLTEAAATLGLDDDAIVMNVQGDEPLVPPELIRACAQRLAEHADCAIATAAHPLSTVDEFTSPNVVKVVLDARGRAQYFSRAPIPFPRDFAGSLPTALSAGLPALRHIGLYAYRVAFLRIYPGLAVPASERFECLEQLRALHHGYPITVHCTGTAPPAGVDTAEDLERVRVAHARSAQKPKP